MTAAALIKPRKKKRAEKKSIAYTNETISDEYRAYLRSLPAHLRIEFGVNTEPYHVLLVHGSPRKINEYLFEDRTDKSMLGNNGEVYRPNNGIWSYTQALP